MATLVAYVGFSELPDHALQQLSDEKLIEYVRRSREAEQLPAGRRALMILVYGQERRVTQLLKLRMPYDLNRVDDVAHDAMVAAFCAAFDGNSVGEFYSWLNTITERMALNFFRKHYEGGKRKLDTQPLPSEHDDNDVGGEPEHGVDGGYGNSELQAIVDAVTATLKDQHKEVIRLHIFGGLTAREVCARLPKMSEDNVAQIASRFRLRMRKMLQEAES